MIFYTDVISWLEFNVSYLFTIFLNVIKKVVYNFYNKGGQLWPNSIHCRYKTTKGCMQASKVT